jgi:hypothetical protein
MDRSSTKADVEAQLEGTREAMEDRIASIRDELSTAGSSVQETLRRYPWRSIAGALLAGLAVGWTVTGVQRRRRLRRAHDDLVDHYLDAVRRQARQAVASGKDVDAALDDALRDHVPLVVYGSAASGDSTSSGWVRRTADLFVSTALRILVRDGVQNLLRRFEPGGAANGTPDEAASRSADDDDALFEGDT